jgi:hypothetical protein
LTLKLITQDEIELNGISINVVEHGPRDPMRNVRR